MFKLLLCTDGQILLSGSEKQQGSNMAPTSGCPALDVGMLYCPCQNNELMDATVNGDTKSERSSSCGYVGTP